MRTRSRRKASRYSRSSAGSRSGFIGHPVSPICKSQGEMILRAGPADNLGLGSEGLCVPFRRLGDGGDPLPGRGATPSKTASADLSLLDLRRSVSAQSEGQGWLGSVGTGTAPGPDRVRGRDAPSSLTLRRRNTRACGFAVNEDKSRCRVTHCWSRSPWGQCRGVRILRVESVSGSPSMALRIPTTGALQNSVKAWDLLCPALKRPKVLPSRFLPGRPYCRRP